MSEKCPVCGAVPATPPEYVFDMAVLADLLRRNTLALDPAADSQKCMRYRYRDGNGHKWQTTEKPA